MFKSQLTINVMVMELVIHLEVGHRAGVKLTQLKP